YNRTTNFLRTAGISEYYNRTDYDFPTFAPINGANVYDPTLVPLNRITDNRPHTTDRQGPEMRSSRFQPSWAVTPGISRVAEELPIAPNETRRWTIRWFPPALPSPA